MQNTEFDFGKVIKRARLSRNMSQEALAKLIGVGKTTVCNYETMYSAPSIVAVEKIARALDYSLAGMLCEFANFDDSSFVLPHHMQSDSDLVISIVDPKAVDLSGDNFGAYTDKALVAPYFMFSSDDRYICIKVPDDTMQNAGISKNDYVFVRITKNIDEKSIVLFLNKTTGEYYIRRYFRDGHIVSMLPQCDDKSATLVRYDQRDNDYKIVGMVEKILRDAK